MENGFDFSQIKWILIFAIVVLFNFFNKKPQVDMSDGEEEESVDQEQPQWRELLVEEEPILSNNITPKPATKRVAKPVEVRPNIDVQPTRELGGEEDEKGVEFDLRQAVIMSEILTRKYDE
ncbi:MAG: hypothetical protein R3Y44_05145 [Rikenellaceae bacterium]